MCYIVIWELAGIWSFMAYISVYPRLHPWVYPCILVSCNLAKKISGVSGLRYIFWHVYIYKNGLLCYYTYISSYSTTAYTSFNYRRLLGRLAETMFIQYLITSKFRQKITFIVSALNVTVTYGVSNMDGILGIFFT